jgi:hypothetical protein
VLGAHLQPDSILVELPVAMPSHVVDAIHDIPAYAEDWEEDGLGLGFGFDEFDP